MRVLGCSFLGVCLAMSLFGCGESESGAGGMAGTGGTAGTSGTAGTGGSGGMIGPTATVSGTVGDGDDGSFMPVEGATVSVVGTSISATTGVAGSWSLEAPEGEVYFQASASGSWSESRQSNSTRSFPSVVSRQRSMRTPTFRSPLMELVIPRSAPY